MQFISSPGTLSVFVCVWGYIPHLVLLIIGEVVPAFPLHVRHVSSISVTFAYKHIVSMNRVYIIFHLDISILTGLSILSTFCHI